MIRSSSRICDKCGKEGGRKRGRNTLCDRCKPKSVKPIHDSLDYAIFIRSQPCIAKGKVGKNDGKSWVHECFGSIQACHVRSRGAGGTAVGNEYPGCQRLHDQQHVMGIKTFQSAYGIDLYEEAKRLHELWLVRGQG